jgi:hypothetical protein
VTLAAVLASSLLMWGNMRNLGLALVLIASVTAPHAAVAKKHVAKRARSSKATKKARTGRARATGVRPSNDDALASAIAEHKREEKPVMTSTVAPPPAAEARPSNAPMTMENQILDDEVPGSRKRK